MKNIKSTEYEENVYEDMKKVDAIVKSAEHLETKLEGNDDGSSTIEIRKEDNSDLNDMLVEEKVYTLEKIIKDDIKRLVVEDVEEFYKDNGDLVYTIEIDTILNEGENL